MSQPIPLYNAHKLAYRIGQVRDKMKVSNEKVYRAAQDVRTDAESDNNSEKSGGGKEEYPTIELPEYIKFTPFFL